MLMAKWCMFALYNARKMVSSVQFCRKQGKSSIHRCETSPVGWKARRGTQCWPWNGSSSLWEASVTSPLHPRGPVCSSVLMGWCLPMGREQIQGDGTGLEARSRESITFLWTEDSPSSFQAHFREMMMAKRTAPFLPSGTHSWHTVLVLIGVTSLKPAADRETSLSTKKLPFHLKPFIFARSDPKKVTKGRSATAGMGMIWIMCFSGYSMRQKYPSISCRRQKLSSPLHWQQHH